MKNIGLSGFNKSSSDDRPESAGRESHEAMESPKALMCPLEKGVRGIERGLRHDRVPMKTYLGGLNL